MWTELLSSNLPLEINLLLVPLVFLIVLVIVPVIVNKISNSKKGLREIVSRPVSVPLWILIFIGCLGIYLILLIVAYRFRSQTPQTLGDNAPESGALQEEMLPLWHSFKENIKLWDYGKFSFNPNEDLLCPRKGSDFFRTMPLREPVSISKQIHLKFKIKDLRLEQEEPLKSVIRLGVGKGQAGEILEIQIPLDNSQVVNIKGSNGQDLPVPIDVDKTVEVTIVPTLYKNRITYEILLNYFPPGENFSQLTPLQPHDVFVDDPSIESLTTTLSVGVYSGGCIEDFKYYFE